MRAVAREFCDLLTRYILTIFILAQIRRTYVSYHDGAHR